MAPLASTVRPSHVFCLRKKFLTRAVQVQENSIMDEKHFGPNVNTIEGQWSSCPSAVPHPGPVVYGGTKQDVFSI